MPESKDAPSVMKWGARVAALAAMDAAEQEARTLAEWFAQSKRAFGAKWARDRMRLIARDRATLGRHKASGGLCEWCSDDSMVSARAWPCPDARAVIDYWQEDA